MVSLLFIPLQLMATAKWSSTSSPKALISTCKVL
jgi:hypothetical protein